MGRSKATNKRKQKAEEQMPVDFEVEKVLDKKIDKGIVKYFIKWKEYSEDFNTWEPEANLECPELVQKYERNAKKSTGGNKEIACSSKPKQQQRKLPRATLSSSKEEWMESIEEHELELEKILGADDGGGKLSFLVKWKGIDEEDLVSNTVMNDLFTKDVIKFYENSLVWKEMSDSK